MRNWSRIALSALAACAALAFVAVASPAGTHPRPDRAVEAGSVNPDTIEWP
ncbi:hypothetical protein SAMN06272735_8999 [Streptomyces sp. TLI_55]|uniref:hypothetical protein n=1 Tax=Streptomyces sp. TLI_55 TaxID=1938861 RepID=UPI000BC5C65E|nr:hypothetical protein [Streptomyces sp. TLI_55]SNX88545.1 hypothetical protein SAMN06272735_8999 [Streptomyces sp. TLI_55]